MQPQQRRQPLPDKVVKAYRTKRGKMLVGKIEDALETSTVQSVAGKVNLIITSPPFPLVRKKQYGNSTGEEYLKWLEGLAPKLAGLLADDGSIVIEIGNAWEQGRPEMSTLPLEALLAFKKAAKLHLCQHVICHNPARLPGPAAWVTVKRLRLKDSYTHVWWLSKTANPKADNRKVLLPYGKDMKSLLKSKTYNAGRRPSGHVISETGFLTNHGGAISSNVIDLEGAQHVPSALLKYANTAWDTKYRAYCEEHKLDPHPARMQTDLVAFFLQFLTDKGDLVFDPFGGSNTTGAVAEAMRRKWIAVEADPKYVEGSVGRFEEVERYQRQER
ncbi:DNA-methyltransferase [Brevundimonas balnearis]|uniref:Methyltransferase n=1 Tax=Brevundimonas balnearis TaxID=1572858 RepID=A0ABV6R4C3_9CAUL